MSTTSLAIQQELVRRLNPDLYCDPVGTATGGSTTTLIDTGNTIYSSLNLNALDGYDVFQEAAGEISHVTRGGAAGDTGTLTLSPAVTTFGSGTPGYQISEVSLRVIQDSIKSVLRNLYAPSYFPLSSLLIISDDNDMETAPATSYTDGTTGGSIAADTTTYFNGAQALKVTAGAANDYAASANFSVTESKTYYASVYCSVKQGDDADFRITNTQDSDAAIENATSDEPYWMELAFEFTTPSGCEQVQARMLSVGSNDETYWDDLILVDTSQRSFPLPSWLKHESQLMDIVEFPRGTGGPASDNDYRTWERKAQTVDGSFTLRDIRATNELRLETDAFASRRYIYAKRPLAEPSNWTTASASTVYAELDEIVEHCLFVIKDPDRADRYLAELRHASLGGARMYAPSRMYSR